jgi:hypothetical protein
VAGHTAAKCDFGKVEKGRKGCRKIGFLSDEIIKICTALILEKLYLKINVKIFVINFNE